MSKVIEWYRIPPSAAAEKRRLAEEGSHYGRSTAASASEAANRSGNAATTTSSSRLIAEPLPTLDDRRPATAGIEISETIDNETNDMTVIYSDGVTTASGH